MERPMWVERNDRNGTTFYNLLCPKCKQYNRIHSGSVATLSGERAFWCDSNICRLRTQLQIVGGRAVQINDRPNPDLGQEKPKPTYESVSTESFTNQAKHLN